MALTLNDLKRRILTALILIPLFLLILYLGGYVYLGLIFLFLTGAYLEFVKLYELGPRIRITGVIWLLALVILLALDRLTPVFVFPLIYFFFIPIFWNKGDTIKKLSLGFFILVYLSFGATGVYLLRKFFGFYHTLSYFLIIWTFDSAAYFTGTLWGKHKLAYKISPNKSIEGYVYGILLTIPVVVMMKYIGLYPLSLLKAITGGIYLSILSQIGDLVESSMKREVGVKDTSTIFPGHGGFLDRSDSIIFTAPFYFIFLLKVV